jgi:peptidoglycan/LPS O-acetylase OafA/YrhL
VIATVPLVLAVLFAALAAGRVPAPWVDLGWLSFTLYLLSLIVGHGL